jgi:hypothetical protein
MKAWHWIAGAGALAVIGFFVFSGKKKFNADAWLQWALTQTWKVGNGNETYTGAKLNIRVEPDGSILIGSGYRGTLVDERTVITKERNGVASSEVIWQVV